MRLISHLFGSSNVKQAAAAVEARVIPLRRIEHNTAKIGKRVATTTALDTTHRQALINELETLRTKFKTAVKSLSEALGELQKHISEIGINISNAEQRVAQLAPPPEKKALEVAVLRNQQQEIVDEIAAAEREFAEWRAFLQEELEKLKHGEGITVAELDEELRRAA